MLSFVLGSTPAGAPLVTLGTVWAEAVTLTLAADPDVPMWPLESIV